jgi:hypothetical protein
MLWIHGLTVIVLVKGTGEMAVMPAVTTVLLHHSAMDIWTDCNIVIRGCSGNGGSAYSYCSTVTSINNDLSSRLYHNNKSVPTSIYRNL